MEKMNTEIKRLRDELSHLEGLLDHVQKHVEDKRDLEGTPYAEQTLEAKISALKLLLMHINVQEAKSTG